MAADSIDCINTIEIVHMELARDAVSKKMLLDVKKKM